MKSKRLYRKGGGSRTLNKRGYYEVYKPRHPLAKKNGYVREHRMIAWDLGILIDPKKDIHHKNGNRSDNRPENLESVIHGEHTINHRLGTKLGK